MDARHRAENLRRSSAMAPLAPSDAAWLLEVEIADLDAASALEPVEQDLSDASRPGRRDGAPGAQEPRP